MTAVRHPTAGELEGRIPAQMIEIIAVLIPAADRKDARTDDAVLGMGNPLLISLVGKQFGKAFDDPDRLEAKASKATPPSDDNRPPSKAAGAGLSKNWFKQQILTTYQNLKLHPPLPRELSRLLCLPCQEKVEMKTDLLFAGHDYSRCAWQAVGGLNDG